MKRHKKIALFFVISLVILSLFITVQSLTAQKSVPFGYTDCEEHFDPLGFMDWTDYCWYQYDSADKFTHREGYQKVTEKDIIRVKGYFDDTQRVLEGSGRSDEYDFAPACISAGDYMKLTTTEGQLRGNNTGKRYGRYDNYELYFFDQETLRLYYISCND